MTDGQLPPEPWSLGDNIPWNDPDFSEAMLKDQWGNSDDDGANSSGFDAIFELTPRRLPGITSVQAVVDGETVTEIAISDLVQILRSDSRFNHFVDSGKYFRDDAVRGPHGLYFLFRLKDDHSSFHNRVRFFPLPGDLCSTILTQCRHCANCSPSQRGKFFRFPCSPHVLLRL